MADRSDKHLLRKTLLHSAISLVVLCLVVACDDDESSSDARIVESTMIATTATATTTTGAPPSAAATAPRTPAGATSPAPAASAASGFLMRITGTDGVTFDGTCEVGGSQSQPVTGTVPAEFELPGNQLRCRLQNRSTAGMLRVQVSRGGQIVNTSETSGRGEIVIQLAFQ